MRRLSRITNRHWDHAAEKGLERKLAELRGESAEPFSCPESPALEFVERMAAVTAQPNRLLSIRVSEEQAKSLLAWLAGPRQLEKPSGSALHRLVEWIEKSGCPMNETYRSATPFLIEHDWAAAMRGAPEGEWRPPAPLSCFEFRVSGKRVMQLAVDGNEVWFDSAVAEVEKGVWAPLARLDPAMDSGDIDFAAEVEAAALPLCRMIQEQVKAACICLEAEVAEKETIRAPYRLNQQRAKRGRLPLYDYHVVSLARRARSPSMPDEFRGDKRRSPRLHFRRGHWVHFVNHKTWRKWCLVGDPDLGFIDKEYRL